MFVIFFIYFFKDWFLKDCKQVFGAYLLTGIRNFGWMHFFSLLGNFILLIEEREIVVRRMLFKLDEFKVKSLYTAIMWQKLSFPWSGIWVSNAPFKVFLDWSATWII